jgi:hypothetical protein
MLTNLAERYQYKLLIATLRRVFPMQNRLKTRTSPALRDRAAELSSEYARLVHLRDEIETPESSRNILLSERLRRVSERIDAVETELGYEIASSPAGALGQAILASADIACMLENECEPKHELFFKERLRRLLYSVVKVLERESGIDANALYGPHAPINPFEELNAEQSHGRL